jgi:hypothetical protein
VGEHAVELGADYFIGSAFPSRTKAEEAIALLERSSHDRSP